MPPITVVIANHMFPESPLPDATFTLGNPDFRTSLSAGQFLHKPDFDALPAIGIIIEASI
jgi:hypothetical protein